jgi:hypothetical protein
LEDVINTWREEDLNIEPVPLTEGPFLQYTQKIPFTYCWSGALVPKPTDWPQHIDVCGFFFRDSPHYEPPADLVGFLEAGPAPIYIGFGSIVVDNPDALTAIQVAGASLEPLTFQPTYSCWEIAHTNGCFSRFLPWCIMVVRVLPLVVSSIAVLLLSCPSLASEYIPTMELNGG